MNLTLRHDQLTIKNLFQNQETTCQELNARKICQCKSKQTRVTTLANMTNAQMGFLFANVVKMTMPQMVF